MNVTEFVEQTNKTEDPEKVYLLKAGDKFKIGTSQSPLKRIKQLQTGNPQKIGLVEAWTVSNPQKIEHELHETFADKQLQGEWFDLSIEDIRQLYKDMHKEERRWAKSMYAGLEIKTGSQPIT